MNESIPENDRMSVDSVLLSALEEDIGSGDVTTSALVPEDNTSSAVFIAKSGFIVAGLPFSERVFHLVDSRLKFRALKKEGARVKPGDVIAVIKGNTAALLKAERTALNLLQRLSGIAALTNEYVKAVKGTGAGIADTRKTAPGLRFFDKYAVRTGGGKNHRFGLFDGILIKDNHISAVGGIGRAVKLARENIHHLLKVEVEVKNISEVKEALKAGADVIMLDNMQPDIMKKAVDMIREGKKDVIIEASGNIDLENVRVAAETGVDLISVGSITHSAPAADISMRFD